MGRGRWGRGRFGGFWGRPGWGSQQPPVNIDETDDAFQLSLFAAGLSRDRVSLRVKDDILTVSYPGAESTDEEPGKGAYREHEPSGFERQFRLNGKVLTDQISAAYANGVLRITLPKDPATNVPPQTIPVG
ncbi:hypothetical protein GCM10027578_22670 [Spirosoma luteolum]